MKFWFSGKGFKDSREAQAARPADDKAPFDATVEQTLRAAQAINAAPSEESSKTPTRDIFDIFSALRAPEPAVAAAPPPETPQIDAPPSGPPAQSRPAAPGPTPGSKPGPRPGPMRAEVERRAANYRAFQMKLNEEREARIRKTMADVRTQLQRIGSQGPPALP